MDFNKTLLKALYDNRTDLFENIEIGDTGVFVKQKEIGIVLAGFYRGCFKQAVFAVLEQRVPLYYLEDFKEWEDFFTDGVKNYIDVNLYNFADRFSYIADPHYLKKNGLDRKSVV